MVAVWCAAIEPSLDPLHPQLGARVVEEHFQRFADRLTPATAQALDFFFQDELMFGLGDERPWSPHLAPAFRARTGYDLIPELPHLVANLGPRTAKVRLDCADTVAALMEDGYFRPIHAWHEARGMTYGCDQLGRGLEPQRYGGYMRAMRWFSAPGHDTPGVGADLIKGKVSSSIAHLNGRPRVWLEGYHSAGWGMDPERVLHATMQNFAYGCNLLSLHGLYYSTHGSHWEWAPPCYHFRMPYWRDFTHGLRGVERLSWLLTRGVHRADVAVVYPVAALDSGLADSPEPAFALMRHLVSQGCDADFIDDTALAAATVADGVLHAGPARFRVLVLADAVALRHAALERVVDFARAGGVVLIQGRAPRASEQHGDQDPAVAALMADVWTLAVPVAGPEQALTIISQRIVRACVPSAPLMVHHRDCGALQVWFLVDAVPGSTVVLRAAGAVELWDPWTGAVRIPVATALGDGRTRVALPDEAARHGAWVLVMRADGVVRSADPTPLLRPLQALDGPWAVRLEPTLDNRWGDWRLPITESLIGAEARQLEVLMPDGSWQTQICGFGVQAWRREVAPTEDAEAVVAATIAGIEPGDWQPESFSWRWGREGWPGGQGYHGLKGVVSDELLILGRPEAPGWNGDWHEGVFHDDGIRTRLLSTTLVNPGGEAAQVSLGGVAPSGMWIDGIPVQQGQVLPVRDGATLLLRYDAVGRSQVVLRRLVHAAPHRTLATRWWCDEALLPWAAHPGGSQLTARCLAPPGTASITLTLHGAVEADLGGVPLVWRETGRREDGARTLVATLDRPQVEAAQLRLRLTLPRTHGGLSALSEPVRFTTSDGVGQLGDWSQQGVLADYSGSVWYSREFTVEAAADPWLDLGEVSGTALVEVDGVEVGVLLGAPWRLPLPRLATGAHHLRIQVSNTLANHYRTLPTRFPGPLRSGLIGPVTLLASTVPS